MPTTSNFGWTTPADTDLVKDGAAAIRTLGNGVDTSFVDLKGGTTGQVLSKASGSDLDFSWVTTDDANAIQNAIVDAKGDLIAASAADTPARLAVGNNGETLVADSSASTGLRWQENYAAGKNKIINGAFDIWQRGTSVSLSNSVRAYGPDRFAARSFFSAGSSTFSQQTFTPGTAPVAGYEGQYFARISCGSTATAWQFDQRLEDARTFAGQTVTFSFWIKASANNSTTTIEIIQNFGSGGSSAVTTNATGPAVTTSWQRFSVTVAIPSVSGKTIGTASFIEFSVYSNSGVTNSMTVDTWGWQVEDGSVATAFQTATGTLAGELAACQRYYVRIYPAAGYRIVSVGLATSANAGFMLLNFPVEMRTRPTALEQSGTAGDYSLLSSAGVRGACTAVPAYDGSSTKWVAAISATTTGHLTAGNATILGTENANGYLGWSAEL